MPQAARVDGRFENAIELQDDIGVLFGRSSQFEIETPPRLLFERHAARVGIQQESVQHDVVLEAAAFNAQTRQFQQRGLHVASDLGHGAAFEPGFQLPQQIGGYGAGFPRPPGEPGGIQRKFALGRFRNRHCDGRAVRHGRHPRLEIVIAANYTIIARARVFGGAEFLQQRMELHILINRLEKLLVGLAHTQGVEVERHRDIGGNGRQALAHADLFAVILQALAVSLALHFDGMLHGRLHRAEAFDQRLRAFVADARRAGDVVDRIAAQRQQVGHLFGPHTHESLHLFGVVPFVVLGGIEHGDPAGHQLQHVLVAGNDDHFAAGRFGAPGQRADHVVGLEARVFQHGNPHGIQQAADVGDLLQQVGRRLHAVGLVIGELFGAVGGLLAFVDGGHVLGAVLPGELA